MDNNKKNDAGSFKRRIFVCSPFRPISPEPNEREKELEQNLEIAKAAAEHITAMGGMPLVPHLYFPQWLDDEDPQDREDGLKMVREWLRMCDEVWLFGNRISDGMKDEIKLAKVIGKPVFDMRDTRCLLLARLCAMGITSLLDEMQEEAVLKDTSKKEQTLLELAMKEVFHGKEEN